MKARLRRFLDSWNFTPTERTVVLTLAGAFVLGLGIRLFRSDAAPPRGFDYSAMDAEFASRSAGGAAAVGETAPAPAGDSAAPPTPPRARAESGVPAGKGIRVELNRASKADLMRLPGIGEVIAARIISYREEHGAFGRVSDLLNVPGIGAKKLGKISPHCYVEN